MSQNHEKLLRRNWLHQFLSPSGEPTTEIASCASHLLTSFVGETSVYWDVSVGSTARMTAGQSAECELGQPLRLLETGILITHSKKGIQSQLMLLHPHENEPGTQRFGQWISFSDCNSNLFAQKTWFQFQMSGYLQICVPRSKPVLLASDGKRWRPLA